MQQDQSLDSFERSLIRQWQALAPRGAGALLAVSGGPDSMALLEASARIREAASLTLEVATVDHGLRPEAKQELELVRARAAALGLPFHVRSIDVAPGAGLEARARQARYGALEAVRVERGLDLVATGHTASDQAETVMMRLGRGTSLKGAAGIHARRDDHVVRPLLFALRSEVQAYVKARGLRCAQDAMNADPAFLRVQVRTQLMPRLEEILGPQAPRALARFAALAAEDEAYLDTRARAALARLDRGGGLLDAVGLEALAGPVQRRVIALLLERAGLAVDEAAVFEARAALAQKRTGTLPGDMNWCYRDGQVGLEAAPARRLHGTSPSGGEHVEK